MQPRIIALPGSGVWDQAGMVTSFLCILHCIVTPLLAASLPVLAVTERSTHASLTLALMAIGIMAFIPGYRQHGRRSILVQGCIGLSILCSAVLLPHAIMNEIMETLLTMLGGGLLILAHLRNAYFCKLCSVCSEGACRTQQ